MGRGARMVRVTVTDLAAEALTLRAKDLGVRPCDYLSSLILGNDLGAVQIPDWVLPVAESIVEDDDIPSPRCGEALRWLRARGLILGSRPTNDLRSAYYAHAYGYPCDTVRDCVKAIRHTRGYHLTTNKNMIRRLKLIGFSDDVISSAREAIAVLDSAKEE